MKRRLVLDEHFLHLTFEVSLVAKALFAVVETLSGVGAFFVSRNALLELAQRLTRQELLEDPRDFVANFIAHSAQHFSAGSQQFVGIYLLIHGVLKLGLIVALLRKVLWAYPLAIGVFGLFIVYQLYRYTLTGSAWLIALTVVDVTVIALTWHEWRYLRGCGAPGITRG